MRVFVRGQVSELEVYAYPRDSGRSGENTINQQAHKCTVKQSKFLDSLPQVRIADMFQVFTMMLQKAKDQAARIP